MQISEFNVTEAALAHAETFKSLKILNLEDKEGYKQVYEARISVKKMRLDIEKKRKELREFWLNGAKKVQGNAKELTARLEPIEEYLEAEQKKIDDEKERIKEEKKAADAQKIQDRVEKVVNLGSSVSLLMLSSMTDMEFEEHLAALQEEKQAKEAELQKEKQEQEEM